MGLRYDCGDSGSERGLRALAWGGRHPAKRT